MISHYEIRGGTMVPVQAKPHVERYGEHARTLLLEVAARSASQAGMPVMLTKQIVAEISGATLEYAEVIFSHLVLQKALIPVTDGVNLVGYIVNEE